MMATMAYGEKPAGWNGAWETFVEGRMGVLKDEWMIQ